MAVVQNPPFIGDPMSTTTVEQVIEALRPVEDPELHRSIVDLDMVHDVAVSSQGVSLTVTLTVAGCPMRNEITDRVTKALTPLTSGGGVSINFGVMTDAQREKVRMMLNGNPGASAGSGQAHGHAEGRAIPFAAKDSKTRPLLISSGKGGVGKSSVTTNLAVALAARGHTVGIVDADIYGFSIPRMLGAERDPVVIDGMLVPPENYGVRALSLSQYLPRGEVFVVTTPQEAAQKVARLSAAMAKKVNLTVRGVIENMSWFTGDDGKRYELFGSGGGAELAAELDVPLLAQIPLVTQLREGGDDGHPIAAVAPESEAGAAFHALAAQIEAMKPKKVFSKGLNLL